MTVLAVGHYIFVISADCAAGGHHGEKGIQKLKNGSD